MSSQLDGKRELGENRIDRPGGPKHAAEQDDAVDGEGLGFELRGNGFAYIIRHAQATDGEVRTERSALRMIAHRTQRFDHISLE